MNRISLSLRSWAVRGSLVFVLAAVWGSAALADVVRVEEDWELVIDEPSPNSDAPQVTSVISPLGNIESLHATFVVNNHDLPIFTAGGLQLQVWDGETSVESRHSPNQAVLTTPGETICWTQAMELSEDHKQLTFEVVGGTSTTWGAFGDVGTLKTIVPTSLANLDGYSPDVSVENSGVSYAANRVQSLKLKEVRKKLSTDEWVTDPDPAESRDVYPLPPPPDETVEDAQ
jgi:hypothetical protein